MNDLIEAVERLLERGIVVETVPPRDTGEAPSVRFRLADKPAATIEAQTSVDGEKGLTW